MSFVIAAPDLVAMATEDLAGIGASLTAANAAAAVPTSGLLAAAGDEVSAAIAALFSWSRRYSTSSRRAPKCEPQSQMYVLKRRVIQNWLGRVVVGINEGRHELDAAASLSDCDCRTVAARLVK